MTAPNVIYVLPNVMGGMLNIVASLIEHRPEGALPCHVVLTDNVHVPDTRFHGRMLSDTQEVFDYALPVENLHAVLGRLKRVMPKGDGVIVCNDLLELALLHVWDPGRMVVQLIHGNHDYYYDLAERHQGVVDVFVTYGRTMHRELTRRLPHRADDVLFLPYGMTMSETRRYASTGPLRLVFAGRLDEGKGVFDLPLIDAALGELGVDVAWTIIGAGPAEAALRHAWQAPHVTWCGALSRDAVLAALPQHDVFVLPTRGEGLPVALVEAMGAGLVPVVSDIESGVPEVVDHLTEGLRPPVGDIDAFAGAVAQLSHDRELLERMSRAAHLRVSRQFDPVASAQQYETVYAQWATRRRHRTERPVLPYGSRLDRPWIPNGVVRSVRSVVRHWNGKG